MDIKTKYNPGQEVWLMRENKPYKMIITSVQITATLEPNKNITHDIIYHVCNGYVGGNYTEGKLFASKEELRDSLFN